MTGRLFDASETDQAGADRRGLRLWGVPASVAIHAAGVAGLLILSLALPEALPPVKAGGISIGDVALPRTTVRIKLKAKATHSHGPKRKGGGHGGPARAGLPRVAVRVPSVIAPLQKIPELAEAETKWMEVLEPCWKNCGPGRGPGDDDDEEDNTGLGESDDTSGPPVHMGFGAPRKLRHVEPIYPPLARQAGIQGQVVLECTLDRDGVVRDLRVIHGNPLLNPAALEAVQQWRYVPTLLNGVPVAVVLNVTVNFRLH
jgi:TonB family protein